jgi:hypothetical protein
VRKPAARAFAYILIVCAVALKADAQKGTAPNGYYPDGFFGTVFTGRVESGNADTQQLTLAYAKGNKTERFVGRLESPCSWKEKNGSLHTFGASEIPQGALLTAFYIGRSSKSGGQKTQENVIFAISFAERDGKPIPDEKRINIFCSHDMRLAFKAF